MFFFYLKFYLFCLTSSCGKSSLNVKTANHYKSDTGDQKSHCLPQRASHLQKVCKPTDSIFSVCAFQLKRLSGFHRSFTSLRCSDNGSHAIYWLQSWCGNAQFPSAKPLAQCLTFDPWMFFSMWLNIVLSRGPRSFQALVASKLPIVSCTDDVDTKWKVNDFNADNNADSLVLFANVSHRYGSSVNYKTSSVLSKASKSEWAASCTKGISIGINFDFNLLYCLMRKHCGCKWALFIWGSVLALKLVMVPVSHDSLTTVCLLYWGLSSNKITMQRRCSYA